MALGYAAQAVCASEIGMCKLQKVARFAHRSRVAEAIHKRKEIDSRCDFGHRLDPGKS